MLARSKNFVASAGTWAIAIAIGIALSGCATTGNRQDVSDGSGWAIAKGALKGAGAGGYVGTLCGPLFLLCAPPLALAGAAVGAAAGAASSTRTYGDPNLGVKTANFEPEKVNPKPSWSSEWHEEVDIPVGRTNGVAELFAAGEVHVVQLHVITATTDVPRLAFLRLLPETGDPELLEARAYCRTSVLDVRVRRLPPRTHSSYLELHTKQSGGQETEPVWSRAAEVICSATE